MLSKIVSVDMGCGNTKIACTGEGVVYSQPTFVIAGEGKEVIAAGEGALEYIRCGRTGSKIKRPVEATGISDRNLAAKMMRGIIKAVFAGEKKQYIKGVFCVPEGLTQVQNEMYEEIAAASGIGDIYFVNSMVACARGAGVNADLPFGTLVVDVGHGATRCGVVAMGECITYANIQKGGGYVTQKIKERILCEYGIEIGFAMAEEIKKSKEEKKEFYGRYFSGGLPTKAEIDFEKILECCVPLYKIVENTICETMKNTPPELVSDIARNGMVLCGGGADTFGLREYLQKQTGIRIINEGEEEHICALGGLEIACDIFERQREKRSIFPA